MTREPRAEAGATTEATPWREGHREDDRAPFQRILDVVEGHPGRRGVRTRFAAFIPSGDPTPSLSPPG